MQTIQITISGEDLSNLTIRNLPSGSQQRNENAGLNALRKSIQRKEVKKDARAKPEDARQSNPI